MKFLGLCTQIISVAINLQKVVPQEVLLAKSDNYYLITHANSIPSTNEIHRRADLAAGETQNYRAIPFLSKGPWISLVLLIKKYLFRFVILKILYSQVCIFVISKQQLLKTPNLHLRNINPTLTLFFLWFSLMVIKYWFQSIYQTSPKVDQCFLLLCLVFCYSHAKFY